MASYLSVSQSTGKYWQLAECRAPKWLWKNIEIRRNKYPTGNIMNHQRKEDPGKQPPALPGNFKTQCARSRYSSSLHDEFMASLHLACSILPRFPAHSLLGGSFWQAMWGVRHRLPQPHARASTYLSSLPAVAAVSAGFSISPSHPLYNCHKAHSGVLDISFE